jgi:hypothetical protein
MRDVVNDATRANVGESLQTPIFLKIPAMFFRPAIALPENAWLMCVVGQTIPFHFPTGE